MSGLSTVTLTTTQKQPNTFSYDESVSCMLFDYGLRPNAFDNYPLLKQSFGNDQIVLVNNLDEAKGLGLIDNEFMNGVPYYHLSKFYNYIGENAPIYIVFAKCVKDYKPSYKIFENIQRETNGKVFQIGIWTEYNLWKKNPDETYGFTELLSTIQNDMEELNDYGSFPMSVVLNAGTAILEGDISSNKNIDYTKLPDALSLDYRYISVLLGQNGTQEIHNRQMNNVNYTPFGLLGYCMACLYLAPAEMSVAYVKNFDINKNDDLLNPELGFGTISLNGKSSFTPMAEINRVRKNIICQNGYIIPIGYQAKEGQVYFSNDQTLSFGDYNCIANNRIISKCRRAIKFTMLQKIKSDVFIDISTGQINAAEISALESLVMKNIDNIMVNSQGQQQIQGRKITITEDSNILETDKLVVKGSFIPAGASEIINMEDSFEI